MSTETTFYRVRRTVDGKHQWLRLEGGTDWVSNPYLACAWINRDGVYGADVFAREFGGNVVTVRHKLIPAKPRTHDRAWALRQLAKGRAVTRPNWTADTRVEVTDLGPRLFTKGHLSESVLRVDIGRSLAEPDGYTLWQEPAK